MRSFLVIKRCMAYSTKIVEHYERPRNVGSLPKTDIDVGIGLVGQPSCGDVLKLSIRVDRESGIIKEAYFKTFGCGSAIASSSYTTELIKGMQLHNAANISNTDIGRYLKLSPIKYHCSMLAEDAIKAAIDDFKSKQ